MLRKFRVAARKRFKAFLENKSNAARKKEKRRIIDALDERQQILSKMTNWQKSQYCKLPQPVTIDQLREIASRVR